MLEQSDTHMLARLVLAGDFAGELFEPVKFDVDGVLAKAVHHILAHQYNGGCRHGEDRQQDGCKQAVADGKSQTMPE